MVVKFLSHLAVTVCLLATTGQAEEHTYSEAGAWSYDGDSDDDYRSYKSSYRSYDNYDSHYNRNQRSNYYDNNNYSSYWLRSIVDETTVLVIFGVGTLMVMCGCVYEAEKRRLERVRVREENIVKLSSEIKTVGEEDLLSPIQSGTKVFYTGEIQPIA